MRFVPGHPLFGFGHFGVVLGHARLVLGHVRVMIGHALLGLGLHLEDEFYCSFDVHRAPIVTTYTDKCVMKLSILMPVYNERTVVERCVSLVLEAPVPENMDRELIIVDDCSTDGT